MTLKIECAGDKNKLAFKTNLLYLYLYTSYILNFIIYIFTYDPIFLLSTFANKSKIEKHAD